MNTLLIQTSGAKISDNADPAYVSQANGPRFCDEPLTHSQYFNAEPYWEQGFGRRRAWQTAAEGDLALLYCTGSVDSYSSSLSHVLKIRDKRIITGEGAWLDFSDVIELEPTLSYARIQDLVERGKLSERMADCGREGFNIRRLKSADLDTVRALTSPKSTGWESLL